MKNVGQWPRWSRLDETGLARYVTTGARLWVTPALNRFDIGILGTRSLLEAVYDSLVERQLSYSLEKFDPAGATQWIRTPAEVLERPREGTCLDLAVTFSGICLACELLPVIVILENHSLVMVSMTHRLRRWRYRPEFELFAEHPVRDVQQLRRLVDEQSFVAVECTGFAKLKPDSDKLPDAPEWIGRENGLLKFDRALEAGREQLNVTDRPLRYALDMAIAQHEWNISSYPLPEKPFERELSRRRTLFQLALGLILLLAVVVVFAVQRHKLLETATEELERKLFHDVPTTELRSTLTNANDAVADAVTDKLDADLAKMTEPITADDDELLRLARRRSRATIISLLGDHANATSHLLKIFQSNVEPLAVQTRSYVIRDLSLAGIDLELLAGLLKQKNVDVAARQALILAVGEYPSVELDNHTVLFQLLANMFREDPDPGVHAAAWWTLSSGWGPTGQEKVRELTRELASVGATRLEGRSPNRRHWFVESNTEITFVYIPEVQDFVIGNIDFDRYRKSGLVGYGQLSPTPSHVRIPRSLLISMTEVTESQFELSGINRLGAIPLGPDFAADFVSWPEAALFCNWFTADETQECYVSEDSDSNQNLKIRPHENHLALVGYRLPTEAEWEYACRGGTKSPFCFGSDPEMLPLFGWLMQGRDAVASLRPNAFGLFDCHGGLAEWCDDDATPYPIARSGQVRVDRGVRAADLRGQLKAIIRGGHYEYPLSSARDLASFARDRFRRGNYRQKFIGFRVARTVVNFPPTE